MSQDALNRWRAKRSYLQLELATIANAAQKFEIQQQIDECDEAIQKIEAEKAATNSKSRKIPFILPQRDVSTFTGREKELEQLEQLLIHQQGQKICSIVGLAGSGGVGKSGLACHFANIHKDDFPEGVIGLRVDGKDADTLVREFARRFGEEVELEDERDAKTIMQDVFAHRRVLLIFDNADNAKVVETLFPGGKRCAVIITTRDRLLAISLDIEKIDLEPLSDTESILLLKRLLGEERVEAELDAAQEIIKLAGNLPLALQIIGAALQLQTRRKLTDYLASLGEERARLKRLKIRGDENLDVYACFSLSLNQLEPQEIDFFACLSVCAEDGFSRRTAAAINNIDDEYTADEYLEYLLRISLLNNSQVGENRFVFHPLIRLFAQELAIERGLYDAAVDRHAQFFVNLVKSSELNDPLFASLLAEEVDDIVLATQRLRNQNNSDYKFAQRLHPFFERYGYWQEAINIVSGYQFLAEQRQNWKEVAKFRIQKAKYFSFKSEWSKAEDVLTPIPNIINKIEGQKARQDYEVNWLTILGIIQQRQGQLEQAEKTFQRSIAILDQLGDQENLAIALNRVGGLLQRQNRLDEALTCFQRQVEINEALNDQQSLAIGLNCLGGLLQQQNRLDEALVCFQRRIEISEALNDQPSLAIALNRVGGLLQQQNRLDDALVCFQRQVEISEALNDQRQLAISLNRVGGLLQKLNRLDEALVCFQRQVEISEALNDQRQLAISLNRVGGLLQKLNRLDEALVCFQRQVEISEALNDQPSLAIGLNCLGGLLQQLNRLDEALVYFQRRIEISEALNDQPSLAIGLNCVGGLLQQQNRLDEALACFQRRIEISEALNDQPSLAIGLNCVGGLLQQLNRLDEALVCFQRQVEISEALNDQQSLAIVLNRMGGLLQQLNRLDEALVCFQRSVAIEEKFGNQRGLTMTLTNVSRLLREMGIFEESITILQRIAAIEAELGNQRGLAMTLTSLSGLLRELGRFDEAIENIQHIISIEEQLGNQEKLKSTLNTLGEVLHQKGYSLLNQPEYWNEARDLFQRSQEIFEQLEHKQGLVLALNGIGKVLELQQKWSEAEIVFRRSQDIAEDLDDLNYLTRTLNSLGRVLGKQKKWLEAEKILRICYDLAVKQEDLRGQAIILNSLGQALQNQEGEDKFKLALMYFRASIKLGEQLEDQEHLAKVHTAMGQALLLHEDIESALSVLCQGFEIDVSLKNARGMEIVAPDLIHALNKLGRYDEALNYCQRALDIAPNNPNLLRLPEIISKKSQQLSTVIKQGLVKFIKHHQEGFRWGFIIPDDQSEEIYFKEGFIDSECISQLAKDTPVEVEIKQAPKGSCAKRIKIIV